MFLTMQLLRRDLAEHQAMHSIGIEDEVDVFRSR